MHPSKNAGCCQKDEANWMDALRVGEETSLFMDKIDERRLAVNRISCEKYLPWTTTSVGEINDACVDREKRIIKRCDGCIEKHEGGEEDDLEKEQQD